MIEENNKTYILKGNNKIINLDLMNNVLKIGKNLYEMSQNEIAELIKIYKYDKEVFKEFVENIYIKYDFSMIDFLINNKVTVKEIKIITNIILFPINFEIIESKKILLKKYKINIVDFFKFIYKRPYCMITENFIDVYFNYLKEQIKRKKLNKYNIFPHNLSLQLDLIENKENFIIKNDNKDIVKDIGDFHLEFYGSKCEYFVTYQNKKYNLLDDNERQEIFDIVFKLKNNNKIYLSEYYDYASLFEIIHSFRLNYYKNQIKKDIFYILKDNCYELSKKELKDFQNMILNINKKIYLVKISFGVELFKKNPLYAKIYLNNNNLLKIDVKLLTSNFKENIFIIYSLSSNGLVCFNNNSKELFYKFKNKIICNPLITNILSINNCTLDPLFYGYEKNKFKLEHKDLQIEKLHLLDIIDYGDKGIYFEKTFDNFIYKNIYLFKDLVSKEEVILTVDRYRKIEVIKQIGKEYSKEFLNKIKKIKIKEI